LFPDDVVFRRIKYATNPGRYDNMKKRAILLYLDDEDDVQVDLALYKVTFFYTDHHGDKVSIESDSDIFSAAKQFTEGGLKVFANVQNRQNKTVEAKNLTDRIAEGIHRYFEDAKKAEENKKQQEQAEFVRRYVEHAEKAEEKKQADLITEAATRRCLEDEAEEKKQADAVTQTLEAAVQKEEKGAWSEACVESESTEETTREEEEQAGKSDEQDSGDETADFMPRLAPRESQSYYPKVSPVKSSMPKEVDIVSKGNAKPNFASDAEGSGEIAAVLGETLDRVAQAIDDMHLEFDRTPSAEEIKKEIFAECAKEVNHEGWRDELDPSISQPRDDGKDDCSHDSWNLVPDDSSDAEPSD
jgi:hypothetical protein